MLPLEIVFIEDTWDHIACPHTSETEPEGVQHEVVWEGETEEVGGVEGKRPGETTEQGDVGKREHQHVSTDVSRRRARACVVHVLCVCVSQWERIFPHPGSIHGNPIAHVIRGCHHCGDVERECE